MCEWRCVCDPSSTFVQVTVRSSRLISPPYWIYTAILQWFKYAVIFDYKCTHLRCISERSHTLTHACSVRDFIKGLTHPNRCSKPLISTPPTQKTEQGEKKCHMHKQVAANSKKAWKEPSMSTCDTGAICILFFLSIELPCENCLRCNSQERSEQQKQ